MIKVYAILAALLMSCFFVSPSVSPTAAAGAVQDPNFMPPQQRESVFQALWQKIHDQYPYFDRRDVDWDKVHDTYLPQAVAAGNGEAFRNVLRETLAQLKDTHTSLVDVRETFARPPLYIAPDGNHLVVAWVQPGSDAEKQGLKAGMVVLQIDGVPAAEAWERRAARTSGSTPAYIRWYSGTQILRGMEGTPVRLKAVFPDGSPTVTATVVRSNDITPFYQYFEEKDLAGGIKYIHVAEMESKEVRDKFRRSLAEAARTNPPGLIIDVRYNGGGVYAHEYANFLFPERTFLGQDVSQQFKSTKEFWSTPEKQVYTGPVVVLTNPGCISMCDVFTTFMGQSGRAVLVGDRPGGAGFRMGVASVAVGMQITLTEPTEMFGPRKESIEGNPVEVTYRVVPTAADWAAGRDPVLEKALEILGAKQ